MWLLVHSTTVTLLLSQGLESHLMGLFWVLSEVVGLLRKLHSILYLVKRQDAEVAWTTFYRVANLKSLANHQLRLYVRLANSKARIKPTAPLSAFDKENSIEFPLDFLHYLYNYYMVCALFSYAYHVTRHVTSYDIMWCDAVTSCYVTMTMWHLWCDTFPHFPLCSKSKIKEKKRKRKEI